MTHSDPVNVLLIGGPAHGHTFPAHFSGSITWEDSGKRYEYERREFIFDGKPHAVGVYGEVTPETVLRMLAQAAGSVPKGAKTPMECLMCGGHGGWPGPSGFVKCKPCNGIGWI